MWDINENCTWRQYDRVIKLRRGQVVDRNGLVDGKAPRKSWELVSRSGTRHQLMRGLEDNWTSYKLHRYNARYDTRLTNVLTRVIGRNHLILWSDFSAYPTLRFAKELTCQQGHRCSLFTSVSLFGREFNDSNGCATDVWTISHLGWNDDLTQDGRAVREYRTRQCKHIANKHAAVFQRLDTIIQVSDKCAVQFRSKEVARDDSEWVCREGKAIGIKRMVKFLKVTGHSGRYRYNKLVTSR